MIPAAWTDFNLDLDGITCARPPLDSPGTIGTVLHLLSTRKVVDALLRRLDPAE